MVTDELQEKNFIHENKNRNPFPFWLGILVAIALIALLWTGIASIKREMTVQIGHHPFLQVTNRQFSLFLWENSEHMRIYAKRKSGYLPDFEIVGDIAHLNPEAADSYVMAPPEILFLYHAWNRLVAKTYFPRPIPMFEFREFLNYAQEWTPKYWPDAPEGYVNLVKRLKKQKLDDLGTLPETILPLAVKKAFQGWKNYFREGDLIKQLRPTYGEMETFLQSYPQYARNHWRNSFTDYLRGLLQEDFDSDRAILQHELTPFLGVAFYNYQRSKL